MCAGLKQLFATFSQRDNSEKDTFRVKDGEKELY